MKMFKTLTISLLATLLVVASVASQEKHRVPDSVLNRLLKGLDEGPMVDIWPYYLKMSSDPENLAPGEALINFTYSPKTDCRDFKVTISEIEKLEFLDDHMRQSSAQKGDTVTLSFRVQIPANDTSGFRFEIDYCGKKQESYSYFTADESTVQWTTQNLSKAARTKPPRQRPENPYLKFERPPNGSIISGFDYVTILIDSDLSIQIPIDSFNSWENQAKDTALDRRIDSLNEVKKFHQEQLEKMKVLRLELSKQYINRDDYIMRRFLETKDSGLDWRVQKGMTNAEIIERNKALFAERQRDDTSQFREVILDLRDPKDYESIKSRRGLQLEEQNEAGFYKVTLPLYILYDLTDQGIKIIRPRPRETQDNRPFNQNESNQTKEDPDGKSGLSQVQGVIWSENFEGAFPTIPDPNHARWYVDDWDASSGLDYWGKENCTIHSGSYSLWCAGTSNLPCTLGYDWSMEAYLETTNGIDLTDVENGQFSFWRWHDMANGDRCEFLQSGDGIVWDYVGSFYGNSNGWQQFFWTLPLNENYYFRFVFYSSTDPFYYGGFYLDDIIISGSQPDLEIAWLGGWSWPLVVSSAPGNNIQSNPLYANEPCYIDWAIENNGDFGATAHSFHVTLYVDDIPAKVWSVDSLMSWPDIKIALDFIDTISAGLHELKIVADSWGEVNELDEFNNDWWTLIDFIPRPQPPNLTWYAPSGWANVIVVNALYAGVPTYIDFAVVNNGGTASGPFNVNLLVDGNVIGTFPFPSLNPGQWDDKQDVPYTFSVGQHIVSINIDPNNFVTEISESDNNWSVTHTWQAGSIFVLGRNLDFMILTGAPFPSYKTPVGCFVELWDADPGGPGNKLAQTLVNPIGIYDFEFPAVPNIEENSSRQDIYLRIISQNVAAVVGDNLEFEINGSDTLFRAIPFYYSTDTVQDVNNGSYVFNQSSMTIDSTVSGHFFIADVINDNRNTWNTYRANDFVPATHVRLFKQITAASGTYYSQKYDFINIQDLMIPNNRFPDTWDKDIIIHEYGHKIQNQFNFFDSIKLAEPSNWRYTSIRSKEFSAKEGFCDFWSCISRTNSLQVNHFNNFADTIWQNLENLVYGHNTATVDSTIGTANTLGKMNPSALAGILWDIFDNNPDDFSDSTTWYNDSDTSESTFSPVDSTDTLVQYHHPDSIQDTLSLGADEILETLFRDAATGHRPDNLNDFWKEWIKAPSQGHLRGMLDIFYEHGSCCVGLAGDANWDGVEANISDLNYMINRIFRAGWPYPCPYEADVNGDGTEGNMVDLNYLINYVWRNGPLPADCR